MLAFSNCASGVLRGAGRSVVPMFTMLICWCGIRVLYVTIALRIIPVFRTISSAYPLTWSLSSIIFIVFLLRMDWDLFSGADLNLFSAFIDHKCHEF